VAEHFYLPGTSGSISPWCGRGSLLRLDQIEAPACRSPGCEKSPTNWPGKSSMAGAGGGSFGSPPRPCEVGMAGPVESTGCSDRCTLRTPASSFHMFHGGLDP